MSALGLRWMSPATAAAYLELGELAPRLSGLLYSQTIPDSALQVILDWSEAVAATDETSSFDLDRLQALMPALVVAFIAEHSYACADPEGIGGCIDLYDEGCGALVDRVRWLIATIAVALHGDAGQHLVEDARADLGLRLNRIAGLIAGR